MKEYCVDLEIAKELEKNNFPQTSYGWYKPDYDGRDRKPVLLNVLASGTSKSPYNNLSHYRLAYAPTSDEILKELPRNINNFDLNILWVSEEKTWAITYDMKNNLYTYDFNLTYALAKMWLYLKKEGYIK